MKPKGFLASLFDTSFSSLVTTKVIRLIYILSMIAIGLLAVVFVVAAFRESPGAGLLTLLVIAPVLSLIYLTYTRVLLELVVALFRIMENTQELVRLGRLTSRRAGRQRPNPAHGVRGARRFGASGFRIRASASATL